MASTPPNLEHWPLSMQRPQGWNKNSGPSYILNLASSGPWPKLLIRITAAARCCLRKQAHPQSAPTTPGDQYRVPGEDDVSQATCCSAPPTPRDPRPQGRQHFASAVTKPATERSAEPRGPKATSPGQTAFCKPPGAALRRPPGPSGPTAGYVSRVGAPGVATATAGMSMVGPRGAASLHPSPG